MPYVTRNPSGNIVELFAMRQFEGQEFVEGAELWVSPQATAKALIESKLRRVGLSQSWQLESAMASILSLGLIQGMTEEQMYALNPGYRDAKDLLAEVRALEATL